MPEVARKLEQEFWRPPARSPQPSPAPIAVSVTVCPQCSFSMLEETRICPNCGRPREAQPEADPILKASTRLRRAFGIGHAALVALAVGLVCLVVAILLNSFYTANTAIEWQAMQLWRIQWLLAAVAAFLAGILLKNAR